MAFTPEETEQWHKDRKSGKVRDGEDMASANIAGVCLHCGHSFGYSEGSVTEDAAMCDTCLG